MPIALAALREPDLPVARLDGVERDLRLLVDHREHLIVARTCIVCRLRWHLHELASGWTPPARIEGRRAFDKVAAHLSAQQKDGLDGDVFWVISSHGTDSSPNQAERRFAT